MYPSSEAPSVMVLDRNTTRGLGDEQGSKEYTFLKRDYEIEKSLLRLHVTHCATYYIGRVTLNCTLTPIHLLFTISLSTVFLYGRKNYQVFGSLVLGTRNLQEAPVSNLLHSSHPQLHPPWPTNFSNFPPRSQTNNQVTFPPPLTNQSPPPPRKNPLKKRSFFTVEPTTVEVHQPEGDSTTSGPTAQDRSAFSYKVIKLRDVKVVPRFIGERGDVVVITFKDGTKVDPRSVPQFREIAKYCLSAAEKPVDLTPVSGPTGY
uniref:Uncharacterized protein n=1 Tax=Populus alba TaxID=43335 RepID=A0A4U5NJX1_POPAL|nr:hypothetical protein D5086_0000264080 [Populus alba]